MTRNRRKRDGAGRSMLAAAHSFYCDTLGGRQMRRTTHGDGSSVFKFRVGADLVTTGPGVADERVTLIVDDAIATAERCWDAGFEVRVHESDDSETIVVVDPFDLELEMVSRETLVPALADAAEEWC